MESEYNSLSQYLLLSFLYLFFSGNYDMEPTVKVTSHYLNSVLTESLTQSYVSKMHLQKRIANIHSLMRDSAR